MEKDMVLEMGMVMDMEKEMEIGMVMDMEKEMEMDMVVEGDMDLEMDVEMANKKMKKDKNYLFVCAFGQSRSRQFAEMAMKNGFKALFCGYLDEADFILNKHYLEWADVIILMDNYVERTIHYNAINNSNKIIIKYYIEDEPSTFKMLYPKLIREINKNDNDNRSRKENI